VSAPAGWYPDPSGVAGLRYWDGSAWTTKRPTSRADAVAKDVLLVLFLAPFAAVLVIWPLVWAIGTYPMVVVEVVGVIAAIAAVWICAAVLVDAHDRRRRCHKAIAARADKQHRALLRGNTLTGVYGKYPPAKL
jgi:Protein of unknown function (DUF2510)